MPRRPPRKSRLREAVVVAKLTESKGNVSAAARALGVPRSTLASFIEMHPGLGAVVSDARETIVDVAESQIYKAVLEGQPWAVALVLRTIGRRRGYTDRDQNESGSGASVVKVLLVGTPPPGEQPFDPNKA